MDEYTIRQAIDLIKAKRLTDARKLLRPVLEVTPTNEAAWVWFASTFTKPIEQLAVMRYAAQFCPNSLPLGRGIERLEGILAEQKARGEEEDIGNLEPQLPIIHGAIVETPASFDSTPFTWDQPFDKDWSNDEKENSTADGDWISSLRTAAVSVDEPEPPVSPQPIFTEPAPIYQPEPEPEPEPDYDVETPVDPFTQPSQQEDWTQEEEVITTPWQTTMPQAPVMWNGQEIGRESVEASPFFSDLNPSTQNSQAATRRLSRSGSAGDPFQTPFWIAVVFGAFLLIILVVFIIVILLQSPA